MPCGRLEVSCHEGTRERRQAGADEGRLSTRTSNVTRGSLKNDATSGAAKNRTTAPRRWAQQAGPEKRLQLRSVQRRSLYDDGAVPTPRSLTSMRRPTGSVAIAMRPYSLGVKSLMTRRVESHETICPKRLAEPSHRSEPTTRRGSARR